MNTKLIEALTNHKPIDDDFFMPYQDCMNINAMLEFEHSLIDNITYASIIRYTTYRQHLLLLFVWKNRVSVKGRPLKMDENISGSVSDEIIKELLDLKVPVHDIDERSVPPVIPANTKVRWHDFSSFTYSSETYKDLSGKSFKQLRKIINNYESPDSGLVFKTYIKEEITAGLIAQAQTLARAWATNKVESSHNTEYKKTDKVANHFLKYLNALQTLHTRLYASVS